MRYPIPKREIIRRALIHAICDREGMIDAYGTMPDHPAAKAAKFEAALFKEMLARDYGKLTPDDQMLADQAAGKIKVITLNELMARFYGGSHE